MPIYALGDKVPQVGTKAAGNCYIADNATVVGDVAIGDSASIWFNAVVRGDDAAITIGDKTNIQDSCVLHVDIDYKLTIGRKVTVGHKAILHGCTIADECLIGMNAVILNGATIGKHCIIGANTLIPQHKNIPDNSVVIGTPGKIIRQVTQKEIKHIKWSAEHYAEKIALYLAN